MALERTIRRYIRHAQRCSQARAGLIDGGRRADMTPDEITQAQQMVRDWKPGDCPSAVHRLGPPK